MRGAQVKIIYEHREGNDEVTLYHHFVRYPMHMITEMQAAVRMTRFPDFGDFGSVPVNIAYQLSRYDNAFVVEPDHDLHFDIFYYYRLYFVGTEYEQENELSKWEFEILTPEYHDLFTPEYHFPKTPTEKEMALLRTMPPDKLLDILIPKGILQKNPTDENMEIAFPRTPLDKIPLYSY